MVAGLLAASFILRLAASDLRFSYGYSHQFRLLRFMWLVQAHAGHTVPKSSIWERGKKSALGFIASYFRAGDEQSKALPQNGTDLRRRSAKCPLGQSICFSS